MEINTHNSLYIGDEQMMTMACNMATLNQMKHYYQVTNKSLFQDMSLSVEWL